MFQGKRSRLNDRTKPLYVYNKVKRCPTRMFPKVLRQSSTRITLEYVSGEAVKYPTEFGTKQVQHKTPVQHIKNAIMNLNLNAKVSVIWECVCQCRASDI